MDALELESAGIGASDRTTAYRTSDDLSSQDVAKGLVAAGLFIGVTALATEAYANTSWQRYDTDRDGLTDHDERDIYHTNPRSFDTDRDGLNDGEEVNVHGTNPRRFDTDGDRYSDGYEVRAGSDPLDRYSRPNGPAPRNGSYYDPRYDRGRSGADFIIRVPGIRVTIH